MSINIYYIRAAIQEKTGIRLDLPDLRRILVQEGMITRAKAKNIIFRGYGDFFDKIDIVERVEEDYSLEEETLEEEE